MKSEKEIREQIEKIIKHNFDVLKEGPATIDVNAPRALMQLEATTKLDALYWVLEQKRPTFVCDDNLKVNT